LDIENFIAKNKSLVIVPFDKASLDVLSSAIATYISLINSGYSVDILYSGEVTEDIKKLAGNINIQNTTPEKHLVISVDYKDKAIEEVNYSIEDNKLNLILKPISNNFEVGNISYNIKGGSYDTAILFGCWNKESSSLMTSNPTVFEKTKIVNIDISNNNSKMGDLNIVDDEFDSVAELTLQTLAKWGVKIPKSAAQLLLNCINS